MRRYGQFCAVQPLQTLAGGGHWARPGGTPPSQIPSPGFFRWAVTQWALSLGHWQLANGRLGKCVAWSLVGKCQCGLFPPWPHLSKARSLPWPCTNLHRCMHTSALQLSNEHKHTTACTEMTGESELRTTDGADPSSPSNSLHKHGSVGLADEMDSPDRVPLVDRCPRETRV